MSRRGELGDAAREPVIGFTGGLFLVLVGMFVPLFATDGGGEDRQTYSLFALREEGIVGFWLLLATVVVLTVVALAFPQRFASSALGTCTMTLTFAMVIGEVLVIATGYARLIARVEAREHAKAWSSGTHTVDMLPWLLAPILGMAIVTACVIAWWSRTARKH